MTIYEVCIVCLVTTHNVCLNGRTAILGLAIHEGMTGDDCCCSPTSCNFPKIFLPFQVIAAHLLLMDEVWGESLSRTPTRRPTQDVVLKVRKNSGPLRVILLCHQLTHLDCPNIHKPYILPLRALNRERQTMPGHLSNHKLLMRYGCPPIIQTRYWSFS